MAFQYQFANVSRNASEEVTKSNITENERITSKELLIVQITCYSAIVLTGSIGNFMLIFALALERHRKTSQYFILNLATVDLLTCIISIPFDISLLLLSGWPFGSVLCRIIYPLQTLFMAVSVATLLCMALERHRAIIHPLKPKIPGGVIKMVITLIWVLSAGLVSPYVFALKMKEGDCVENWPNNDPIYPKLFTLCVFLILYMGPLCVISVAYTRVGIRLHGLSHKAELLTASKKWSKKYRARQNIRVVKVFVIAVVAFAFCLLPFQVMWMWSEFGNGQEWKHFSTLLTFANVMVYANSAVNPYIFGALGRKYNSCRCFYQRIKKAEHTKRKRVFFNGASAAKRSQGMKEQAITPPGTTRIRSDDKYCDKERLYTNNNAAMIQLETTV